MSENCERDGQQDSRTESHISPARGASLVKVNYRPPEAAIRWSGLIVHERDILRSLDGRQFPDATDFPQWPSFHLASERIKDAILNNELPVGQNGITMRESAHIDEAKITIRHVDLKDWMIRRYPSEKPEFLFSDIERAMLPLVSLDGIRALAFERDALRSQLAERDEEIRALRIEVGALLRSTHTVPGVNRAGQALSSRAERTLLHIIGGQLALLLGKDSSGKPYSRFRTQEEVIAALTDQFGERLGLSKSTLESKFASARKMFSTGRA